MAEKKLFSIAEFRSWLEECEIYVRRNVISGDIEFSGSGFFDEWDTENAMNIVPIDIADYFRHKGYKGVNKNIVADYIESSAEKERYNPVVDMFESGSWDERDRLTELYEIWGVRAPFYQRLIYRWLIQCVAMAHNSMKSPYGADGVLTLQGAQGIGKTSALRALCLPVEDMFKGGATLDPSNKDSIIMSTSHWIVELGELERTTRYESSHLKALLTAEVDQYRSPYARSAIKKPRRTSFAASVNPGEFLVDDTGSRRYWTVPMSKIDLDRLFKLDENWVRQLWYQMYEQWRELPDDFRLTGEERRQLEEANQGYTKAICCEMEVLSLFKDSVPLEEWEVVRPAEVAKMLTPTPPAEKVGRALARLAKQGHCKDLGRDGKGKKYSAPIVYVTLGR